MDGPVTAHWSVSQGTVTYYLAERLIEIVTEAVKKLISKGSIYYQG